MEKAYKTMTASGASGIVVGVIMVVTGVAAGILSIVGGARLLKNRNVITF